MYQPELQITKEPEITVIPSFMYLKLADLLAKRGLPCRKISRYDLPEGCPGGCTYLGKSYTDRACGIETHVDKECLFQIAEEMFHISPDEVI